MSLWRQITRGLSVLTRRRAADDDLGDEVRHYFDLSAAAHEARGLSPADASRAASLELGNTTVVRERVRSYGWENTVGTLAADLRFAARRLRSDPGFATVAVLTLALGIGASTAIFSAVNPILFEPLPYPRANQIITLWDRGDDGSRVPVTFGTFRELLARSRSFTALAVMRPWQPPLTGLAEPERLDGQRVSALYFRVLGVPPALGRDFDEADDRVNGPRVAILSDGLLQRRFGGDRTIVGREITLGGDRFTVVGVMPRGFENVLAPSAEIWAPLQYDTSLPLDGREWGHHLRMAGRLRADVKFENARAELDAIARTPQADHPRPVWAALENSFVASVLQEDLTRGVRPALLAVLGAVLLVLAIACVNVTNLVLARGAQRRGELAMRAALGAGRGRLVRQLLTESLLLAGLGGALAIAVAAAGVHVLVALSPADLPRIGAIRLDAAVFSFALAVTTVIGLAVGLAPALQASRADLHLGIQRGSRRTSGGHRLTRHTLVVAEVALALVLLVSAGLLLRSVHRLLSIPPGFDAAHVLTMQVQLAGHDFDEAPAINSFFDRAEEAVRNVPGVEVAGFTSQLPLSGENDGYGVHFASIDGETGDAGSPALRYAVTDGYFAALRVPLLRGRLLDARDKAGAPGAMLLSESFAKRVFHDRDPLGERVRVGSNDGPWSTVVGVVGDVKQASLASADVDAVYLSAPQWRYPDRALWLVVRARGDAAALASSVKRAVWSVDRDQPIVRVATMEHLLAASAAERRFALTLFEAFGAVALALAAIGIYGVLAGGVAERTREIGVRAALGASRADILGLVARQGLALTAIGVMLGLAIAGLATDALASLLFGVSRLDPITYIGVIVLLASVAGLASWVPALRASRVDPAITLRAE